MQDLAALNKAEMLIWDQWGILNDDDPLELAAMLDELARAIVDPGCPVATLTAWARRDGFAVTPAVTSYSPTQFDPLQIDVSRVFEGMLRA